MIINIPEYALEHFWEEPPTDTTHEFWAFRFPPRAKIGDTVLFRYAGEIIASAVISKIEAPYESECEGTGRFRNRWKVFWEIESFRDLRTERV